MKKVKRAAKREEGRRRDVVLCAMASSCKAEAATASRLPQSGRLASIHSDPPADFTHAHRRSKTLAACSDVVAELDLRVWLRGRRMVTLAHARLRNGAKAMPLGGE